MKSFLIDAPTAAAFWVTANTEREAIDALYQTMVMMELRFQTGKDTPIELIDFTTRGEPKVLECCPDDTHGSK
ncbi:hypothetical protein LJR251_002090 [Rhizobium rhizogenes]|uniref:hypothetical protein n=1 Tax=Rhizobium rhizogenes TaxID=359 RepID=UPI003ECCDA33